MQPMDPILQVYSMLWSEAIAQNTKDISQHAQDIAQPIQNIVYKYTQDISQHT